MFETSQIDTQEDLLKEYHKKVEKLLQGLPETQRKIFEYSKVLGNVLIGFIPGSSLMSAIKDFINADNVRKKLNELSGKEGNIEQTQSYAELVETRKKIDEEIEKLRVRQTTIGMIRYAFKEEKTQLEKVLELNRKDEVSDAQLLRAILSDFKKYNLYLEKVGAVATDDKREYLLPLLDKEIKKEQDFVDFLMKLSARDYRIELEMNLFLKELLPKLNESHFFRTDHFASIAENKLIADDDMNPEAIDENWKLSLNEIKNEENICAGLAKLFTAHINRLMVLKKSLEDKSAHWNPDFWKKESASAVSLETNFYYALDHYIEWALGILDGQHATS